MLLAILILVAACANLGSLFAARGADRARSKLVEKFPNFVFTERGEPQALNGVGRLDWRFGPAGEEAVITGIEVLVLKGDKIGGIYTFLNQRKT